jgi:hypothetical protein
MGIIRAIIIIALGGGAVYGAESIAEIELQQVVRGLGTMLITSGLIYGAVVILWEASKLVFMALTGVIILGMAVALYMLFLH